jgi:hypothetical protein
LENSWLLSLQTFFSCSLHSIFHFWYSKYMLYGFILIAVRYCS